MRRRSLFTLGIFSSLATLALGAGLTACEDGPNQSFSPAPASAGNFWNNGNPDASVGSATQNFDASNSTNITPLNLCSPDKQREVWAEMLTQPILPGTPYGIVTKDSLGFPVYSKTPGNPYGVFGTGTGHVSLAGLDLDGQDFGGITISEAEAQLCSSIPGGGSSDGITSTVAVFFGEDQEVEFEYVPGTLVVGQMVLGLGYTGAADFWSDPKSKLDPPDPALKSQIPGTTGEANMSNHYHIVIGQEIQKNNQPFPLDWNDPQITTHMQIYNAQMFYYGSAQGLYIGGDNPNNCENDQSCLFYPPPDAPSNGGLCIFGIRPLLTYWETNCQTQLQPGVSTIAQMYFDFGKVMPFSHMAQDLRISNIGPSTHPRPAPITTDPPGCNQYLGLDFGTFLKTCGHVNTEGQTVPIQANLTDVYFAKLTGGHTHNNQSVIFNVVGINMSWDDENANIVGNGATTIVNDYYLPCTGDPSNPTVAANPSGSTKESCPGNPDLATDWEFDVRTDAQPDNDNLNLQGEFSQRGTGLVQREWATLVQADMNAILQANPVPGVSASSYTHQLGDTACFNDGSPGGIAAAHNAGCTGFEGYAIAGSPETTDGCSGTLVVQYTFGPSIWQWTGPGICSNFNAGGYASQLYGGYASSALTPGDPTSYFCQDPTQAFFDNGSCVDGAVWTNALQSVVNTAGGGNPNLLPWQLKDRRYFFRWWGISMIKYYMAYGANPTPFGSPGNLTFAEVDAQKLDLTSLFFDNNFGASFDKDEYIVRGNNLPGGVAVQSATPITGATANGTVTVPSTVANGLLLGPAALPMDYTYGSDTLAANQRYTDWYKRMDREEAAMFKAMLVNKSDLPGSENDVNITNLAGSPLLAANYGSYECATQYPNVTIPGAGITNQPWENVCAEACPALPQLPGTCPLPPGVNTNGFPDGDQNGVPANPLLTPPTTQTTNLAGGLVAPQVRLFAYPSVWGGTGAFCVGSGDSEEGDSYSQGSAGNPFQGNACGGTESMTANLHGSVFKVGGVDPNNARIQFLNSDGTPQATPPTGTAETLTAFINIPNMTNPFNNNTHVSTASGFSTAGNGSKPLTGPQAINVSVPWTPSQENVGFPIPISGTTNKFVQTAQLDFTGVLETYVVDYEPWVYVQGDTTKTFNAAGTAYDGTIKIDAIEGDDFLGEVFLCQDNGGTGSSGGDKAGTQDLLGVHMYDSGGQVLEWLAQHPGVQDSCNVIVQYSEFNNYLDYIASLSAGVVVAISQGSGYGRVSDVVVFDPGIAQIP